MLQLSSFIRNNDNDHSPTPLFVFTPSFLDNGEFIMSEETTIGQTPYVQQEDTTIHQPTSMYEASKEVYRMERQKTLVAARYVRNSDPYKKDSEVLKAQADALSEYAKKNSYDCPDHLLYVDAIPALKYPY